MAEECAICLEDLERRGGVPIVNPGCGHDLHVSCLISYQNNGKTNCPTCRKEFVVLLGSGGGGPSNARKTPTPIPAPSTPQKQTAAPAKAPPTPVNGWLNVDVWELPPSSNLHIRATLQEIYQLLSWPLPDPTFSTADYYRLGYKLGSPDFMVINVFNPTIKLSINTSGRQMRVTPKIYSRTQAACPNVPREFWGGLREITDWVHSTLHPLRNSGKYVLPPSTPTTTSTSSKKTACSPADVPPPKPSPAGGSSSSSRASAAGPSQPLKRTAAAIRSPSVEIVDPPSTPSKKPRVAHAVAAPRVTPSKAGAKKDGWQRAKRVVGDEDVVVIE
ncbi:hypothetical protein HDU98_004912 [Podochytrium sp. JEL0797]|nr:hypothetical protein HDU98_004912 [Podochytrium sp. JEL0797]